MQHGWWYKEQWSITAACRRHCSCAAMVMRRSIGSSLIQEVVLLVGEWSLGFSMKNERIQTGWSRLLIHDLQSNFCLWISQ
jgi:hypothetical protein